MAFLITDNTGHPEPFSQTSFTEPFPCDGID